MARLHTSAMETVEKINTVNSSGSIDGDTVAAGTPGPKIDNTTKQSGKASWKCDSGATGSNAHGRWNFTGADGVNYFARGWMCFQHLPGADIMVARYTTSGGTVICSAKLKTTGKLALYDESGVQIGSDSAATISADASTFYRIELRVKVNTGSNDETELVLNGTQVAVDNSNALSATVAGRFELGWCENGVVGNNKVCWIDNVIVNDSTGSSPFNTWPEATSKVISLHPASDNARNGFTGGAGGTSNLYDALDNRSPTGVVFSSGTNTSQIKSTNTNTTDDYSPNLETPSSQGVAAADTIRACVICAFISDDTTTTTYSMGLQGTSNPSITEVTASTGAGVASTWPSAWNVISSPQQESPSITYNTAPVLRGRRNSATAGTVGFCSMWMNLEYVPAPNTTIVSPAASATANTMTHVPKVTVLPTIVDATASSPAQIPLLAVLPSAMSATAASSAIPTLTVPTGASSSTASTVAPTIFKTGAITPPAALATAVALAPVVSHDAVVFAVVASSTANTSSHIVSLAVLATATRAFAS